MLRGFFGPYFDSDDGTAAAGGDGAPDPTPASGGNTGGDAKYTQADVDRLIGERLNREGIKDLKKKAAEYDKFQEANKTEAEKVAARLKDLESKEATLTNRERTIAVRDGLAAAATAEKLALNVSTATVIRLLDLDAVDFDASGNPTNLGPLLKQLAKDEPKMFEQQRRTGSADGGTGGGSAPLTMNELIRQRAGR